jgi:hypothetical protein
MRIRGNFALSPANEPSNKNDSEIPLDPESKELS